MLRYEITDNAVKKVGGLTDDRFDYLFVSFSLDSPLATLKNRVVFKGSGKVVVDNGYQSGDTDNRFCLFAVKNGRIEKDDPRWISLMDNDKITVDRFLSDQDLTMFMYCGYNHDFLDKLLHYREESRQKDSEYLLHDHVSPGAYRTKSDLIKEILNSVHSAYLISATLPESEKDKNTYEYVLNWMNGHRINAFPEFISEWLSKSHVKLTDLINDQNKDKYDRFVAVGKQMLAQQRELIKYLNVKKFLLLVANQVGTIDSPFRNYTLSRLFAEYPYFDPNLTEYLISQADLIYSTPVTESAISELIDECNVLIRNQEKKLGDKS